MTKQMKPLSDLQMTVLKRLAVGPGSYASLASVGVSPSTLRSLEARGLARSHDGSWYVLTEAGREMAA